MSFLSGIMGGKADELVDKGVDAAATLAKQKVKDLLGGDSNAAAGATGDAAMGTKEGEGDGGKGGLSFSSGDKPTECEGGGGGGATADFTDLLAGVVGEKDETATKDDPVDQLKSIGKGLFG